jgi:hypothetical protein
VIKAPSRGLLAAGCAAACVIGLAAAPTASATAPHVLRVGTWNGIAGPYHSIADAVAAAAPGDWILVGPGDYKERADYDASQATFDAPSGVLIRTPGLHLRGMDRNQVVVDGTKPGSPTCSSAPQDQDYGPPDGNGGHRGRNGITVFEVDGTYVENLTVCNFLTGSASTGNEIWWNGGDGTGHIGMNTWWGNYLSTTSTFYDPAHPDTAAAYGLFVSDSRGPGSMSHTYASNFNDSDYYIGGCPDCNAVIDDAHAQYSALGYSGTNSGGHLIIENSEWDHNKTGIVTNSQNNDDWPSPQDGMCPNGGTGPTGTTSCEVWRNNYVHDNNNPNVPAAGAAAAGPVGTGMVVAGGRYDTLVDNRVENNDAWGILTVPYPDTETAPADAPNCKGGFLGGTFNGQQVPCLYDDWGNEIAHNTLANNGSYGNATNGDLADLSVPPPEQPGAPANCWHDNTGPNNAAPKTWPVTMQTTEATCGNPLGYPDPASTAVLTVQAACATQALGSCPDTPLASYPRQSKVVMPALTPQPTMPDPCAGVPANPWCPGPGPTVQQASQRAGAPPAAVPASGGPALALTGLPSPVLPATGAALLLGAAVGLRRRRTSSR